MGSGVKRQCGACVACCVYLKINTPGLKKPGMTHCPHLNLTEPIKPNTMQLSSHCGGNCTNPNKPDVCQEYECLWLQGYGAEQDRPDKSLMLIDNVRGIDNAIECKPLCEGADTMKAGREAIVRISRHTGRVALVTSFYETRLAYVLGKPV